MDGGCADTAACEATLEHWAEDERQMLEKCEDDEESMAKFWAPETE